MECKICNSSTLLIEDTQFKTIYHHCQNCEFIFLDEKFFVCSEEEKKQYDFHKNTLENEGYVNMFRDFLQKAGVSDNKNIKTALDYGSGPGPVLAHVLENELNLEVDVYDPYFSPKKVFENKTYDLITSTEVFEHFQNPLHEIQKLKGLLKKGGTLAIMTMFHYNDQEHFLKWWYRRDTTHIGFYSPKTFEAIASQFNLELSFIDEKNICVLKKA